MMEAPNIVSAKIVSLEEIAEILSLNRQHKKIVQCHGVFDLLHLGHIKHLQTAKNYGDILIVTVTTDRFVNKGVGRPYFSERLRAEALAALSCVDYVIINNYPKAIEAIQTILPDFYVKGSEYQDINSDVTGHIGAEEIIVKSLGIQLKFTQDIVFSSSTLLNQFFSPFDADFIAYLKRFKEKYSVNDVLSYFDDIQDLKISFSGEAKNAVPREITEFVSHIIKMQLENNTKQIDKISLIRQIVHILK